MSTNYCSTCKYMVETEYHKYLKRLPNSPTNMNSIILQTIASNMLKEYPNTKIPCCNNENNYSINYVDGSIEVVPCDEINHYGECTYWEAAV